MKRGKEKNQRANHICGWQIKNREWPLCDSESSIFFLRRWRRCWAKTRSLAGGVREHKQNRNNNIARAGAVLCWRRGGVRGLRDEREPTDGRLKEKDAQSMTRRTTTHQGPCPAKVEPLEHCTLRDRCRGVQSLLFTPACAPAMQRQSSSTET
jgi:hypothetical protein